MFGTEVDKPYLDTLLLAVKGKPCAGCARFIRSRHTIKHGQACPELLALRLRETMDETLRQELHYRKVVQDNERLYSQLNEMTYQLVYFRNRRLFRRHVSPDDGEDSDGEESGGEGDMEGLFRSLPPPASTPTPV